MLFSLFVSALISASPPLMKGSEVLELCAYGFREYPCSEWLMHHMQVSTLTHLLVDTLRTFSARQSKQFPVLPYGHC